MSRPPPAKSRKDLFVEEMNRLADDNTHGYSQKPPSGRWGPDYDCSSIVYAAANKAGYPVGTGGDKVRFTGTMLKDFEKAGFQILPFANVGISDLKIGDILLNLALHAEVYVGEGQTVGATSSETGGFVGESGDQTGHEIERHPVTTFDKDWDYVLRPPEDDNDEEIEEGDDEMPMNYGPNMPSTTQPWGNPPSANGMYQQGSMMPMPQPGMNGTYNNYNRPGYPQGNLGQMNGYAQANAGGYSQPGGYSQGNQNGNQIPMGAQGTQMETDYCFVKGIEGARNSYGIPNSRKPLFDEDKSIFYAVTYGPQGTPVDIHPYKFMDDFELMEEMPQHLSPLMQHAPMGNSQMVQPNTGITKEEIVEIVKEVINNESSIQQSEQLHGSNAQQRNSNGSRGNRSNQ